MNRDFVEATQRVTNTDGMLMLLELKSRSMSEPERYACDTEEHTYGGKQYAGVPFAFKMPESVPGSTGRAQLVVDNVGRGISELLESLQPNEVLMGKFILCRRVYPLVAARQWYLPITNVSIGGVAATADAGADFLMRQKGVKIRFVPSRFSGLF